MAIENIQINVIDVARSVDFYTRFLAAELVGDATDDGAVLDVVTATIELVRAGDPAESSWEGDDLQRGFRHIGFKVADVDALVAPLKAAGVPFHLDPLEAEGGVRITFFFDPDGTLLELVERDLQYNTVSDEALVEAERALGVPSRPRFDHIAVTVDDFEATKNHYGALDFAHHGTILQPHDSRGFSINFLKSGDTVLEIFSYDVEKHSRPAQLDATGYVAARLTGSSTTDAAVGTASDGIVYADADGLTYTLSESA
jgi:catechol 2,3-dioxygenase-like lactoylglutathione lyase family enzyme